VALQCNHHSREKQSNCAAGGNPNFPEIGNLGSRVTWQHLWQHPENIAVVPYGAACTWQLTAKLHVF